MSEHSWAGRGARSVARFVSRRSPLGLSDTDLAIALVGLAVLIVSAMSESSSCCVRGLTLAGLVAASWLPLLLAAGLPLTALVLVTAVEIIYMVHVPLTQPVQFNAIPVAVMVAAYFVAARRGWRIAWVAGGAAALTLLAVGLIVRPSGQLAANMYAFDLVLAAAGTGTLLRSRRLRLQAMETRAIAAERTREEEARRRVAAERLRMARELHDVVAHNLALINAQSSVAEYLLRSDPAAAAKALNDITRHTRQALDELRATVGLLRQADDDPAGDDQLRPLHGLSDLGDLVGLHRDSGAEVTMTVAGEPHPVPAMSELAVYRIVQESLTNATKHAPGAAVTVNLRWTNDRLELRVDNGPSPPGEQVTPGAGTGHGLIGMRERALAARGSLHSGPGPQGGFTVTATIPIGNDEVNERQGPS